ncbi:hypothetical protein ACP70R_018421 [Stipagrostis hirtigluma subsp. patula]
MSGGGNSWASPVAATSEAAPEKGATPGEATGVVKRPLLADAGAGGGAAPKRARTVSGRTLAPHPNKSLRKGAETAKAKLPARLPSGGRGRGGLATSGSAPPSRTAIVIGPQASSPSVPAVSSVGPTEAVRVATSSVVVTAEGAPVVPPALPPPPPVTSGVRPAMAFPGVDASGFHLGRMELPRASGEGTFALDDPAERAAWTVAGNAINDLAKQAEDMAAMARRLRVPLQGVRNASVAKSLHLVEHAKALQEVTRLRSELEKTESALWKMGAEKNQLDRDLAESRAEEKRLRGERNRARDDANRLRNERADLIVARDKAEEAFQLERDARAQAERSLGAEQARREEVERQCASLGSEIAELGPLRASATRVCEFLEVPIPPQGRLPARLEGLVPRVHELEEAAMASGAGTAFAVVRSYYDNLDVAPFVEGFAGWCTDEDMAALATSSAPDGEAFARRFAPAVLPPRELPPSQ